MRGSLDTFHMRRLCCSGRSEGHVIGTSNLHILLSEWMHLLCTLKMSTNVKQFQIATLYSRGLLDELNRRISLQESGIRAQSKWPTSPMPRLKVDCRAWRQLNAEYFIMTILIVQRIVSRGAASSRQRLTRPTSPKGVEERT